MTFDCPPLQLYLLATAPCTNHVSITSSVPIRIQAISAGLCSGRLLGSVSMCSLDTVRRSNSYCKNCKCSLLSECSLLSLNQVRSSTTRVAVCSTSIPVPSLTSLVFAEAPFKSRSTQYPLARWTEITSTVTNCQTSHAPDMSRTTRATCHVALRAAYAPSHPRTDLCWRPWSFSCRCPPRPHPGRPASSGSPSHHWAALPSPLRPPPPSLPPPTRPPPPPPPWRPPLPSPRSARRPPVLRPARAAGREAAAAILPTGDEETSAESAARRGMSWSESCAGREVLPPGGGPAPPLSREEPVRGQPSEGRLVTLRGTEQVQDRCGTGLKPSSMFDTKVTQTH